MIDQFCIGRDNNFNLLRLIAAFSVAVSHATLLTYGAGVPEPLLEETGYTLGHHAVNIFFMISGFLIYQSYMMSSSLLRFTLARVLRIIPALIVACILVVVIGGLGFTTRSLPDYWSSSQVWIYLFGTSSAFFSNLRLPGLFETLPAAAEVNGSLWTLKWELMAYFCVPLLGLLGFYASGRRFAMVLGGFLMVYLAISLGSDLRQNFMMLDDAMRLGLCFLIGMAIYHYRSRLALSVWFLPIVWAGVWLLRSGGLYEIALMVAMAYTVFWLAFIPAGWVRRFNLIGDYSYGIYIYHFPIMQMVLEIFAPRSANETLAIACLAFLPIAVLSYHLVEKPALGLKHRWQGKRLRALATDIP